MSYPQSVFTAREGISFSKEPAAPAAMQAQQNAQDAMAFQLWASSQSHSLARLKIFHTMAKTINDQQ